MKELEEKLLYIIKDNQDYSSKGFYINKEQAAKECTKLSIQYTIGILKEISGLASEDRQEATINKIEELTKQLNEL